MSTSIVTNGRQTTSRGTHTAPARMAAASFSGPRPSLGGRSATAHRRKEAYAFPMLKNGEIVSCLNELGLDVTEDTLTRARPDALHEIYEHLVKSCLDMSKDELYQPKFHGLDALKHTELHEDSVPALHFVRAM
jgi:hypothetical protein